MNSIRAREPLLEQLIKKENPDIICLQELKTENKNIVEDFFKLYDYESICSTQKAYNGVAIAYKNQKKIKNIDLNNLHKKNCI